MKQTVMMRMVIAALAAGALALGCARETDGAKPADAATATGKAAGKAADATAANEDDLAGGAIDDADDAVDADDGIDPGDMSGDPGLPEPNAPPTQAGETGGLCGGIAGIPCRNDADYCATPEGECGRIADLAGLCRAKPEICTMDYNPVCGCDGRTYANACGAAAAGVSVKSRGECAEG